PARRADPARHHALRASRHRQDDARASSRCGSRRAVHYASGSDFVEKYVGVGARRIRDLFAKARKMGRGVIFFDEFDAVGKARGGQNSHEEREQTLNQLLVELDGFSTTDDIVVIAATNRLD